MLEIPEAAVLAQQLTATIKGKRIKEVVAGYSPHKFAWYHGDPTDYNTHLQAKTVGIAVPCGGLVEVYIDDYVLLFADGVALRFHEKDAKRPLKHQLLIDFDNGTTISASAQMYGGMWCFREDEFDSPYYDVARENLLL